MSQDPVSVALDRVMVRFARMLRSAGRRRGLDEADLDELAQDVRVRLWRSLSDHEKIETVRTSYVYRTAMTAALDLIRRRRTRSGEPIEAVGAGRIGQGAAASGVVSLPGRPDTDLESRELGRRIDRAVDGLAEPRDVIVRLHLSGYDRHEIAELLGWTEPKVRNLLYRGLADLREALREQGIGPGRTS